MSIPQLFQPCFLTLLQSDEQLPKKARIETEQVASGSVCLLHVILYGL
jgi:hypothetical protein